MRACDGCRKTEGVEEVELFKPEGATPPISLAAYDLCATCRQAAAEGRLRFRILSK